MGFIAPALPAIGGVLGSLFGGGGGGAAGIAGPLIGAGLSAFGQGGGRRTTQTGETTRDLRTQFQETEIPELAPFRRDLIGGFQEELDFARQPVFGDEAKAQFISGLNRASEQAFENIGQRLAASGAGRSGRAGQDITGVELERGRRTSEFLAGLPFQERQARLAGTLPLLQTGLSFVGRGPRGGTTAQQGTTGFTQETAGRGPGFLRGLAGQLGDVAGTNILLNNLGFGNNRPERFDPSGLPQSAGFGGVPPPDTAVSGIATPSLPQVLNQQPLTGQVDPFSPFLRPSIFTVR